jgi:hypothetical protein
VSAKPWLEHRVLVTVGTGGVGKTTVGAAIGLEAARRGKRALVVTIDPARRLADALGVGELGHEPRTLPRKVLRKAGIEGRGELVAMMLDTKRTFDELVSRYSPDEEALERILANPIYQNPAPTRSSFWTRPVGSPGFSRATFSSSCSVLRSRWDARASGSSASAPPRSCASWSA